MRSNFAKFKELGVTDEHRATAIAIIERNKPNMALNARNAEKYLQERQLEQAKSNSTLIFQFWLKPIILIMEKSYSQVLKAQFKAQRWACLSSSNKRPENRKEYTLTYTENQVKILENIEINRKTGNHRTMRLKDSSKTPYFAITATFNSFSIAEYCCNSKHG